MQILKPLATFSTSSKTLATDNTNLPSEHHNVQLELLYLTNYSSQGWDNKHEFQETVVPQHTSVT